MMVPRPPNPQDLKLPADANSSLPDFSAPLKETKINVRHYGELTARIFQSKTVNSDIYFMKQVMVEHFLARLKKYITIRLISLVLEKNVRM